jgi:DNA-binding protein HU-beta
VNKQELAEAVARKTNLTPGQVGKALDAVFSPDSNKGVIAATLKSGGKVTLAGFGTFETRHRKARMGRNPRTGATIEIAAHKSPAFRPGKTLKDEVGG